MIATDHELDEIVKDFLVESYENLVRLDADFLTLEKHPTDEPTLARVFRTIHTIKGTCGFFGFHKLETVSHVGENLLSQLRDGAIRLSPNIATALLKLVDAIRTILQQIETTGVEGEGDYTPLVDTLTRLMNGTTDSPPPIGEAEPVRAMAAPGGLADTTIRVDVALIDKLMTLVGELVLARNQIEQFALRLGDAPFARSVQRLNAITGELQEGVMKTRMQPVGHIWDRFPRIVRDLAAQCGKQVRLELEGKDTELDRSIVEAMKDPLAHIVRNAIDHGIELPAVRVARGKPAEGCLRMRAFHEGGYVIIEIRDDGGGIPPAKVKDKAIEKGLITIEQAANMSDAEAIMLVCTPGFSTADAVTNLSGRGVGMDVVKTNIEAIGGTLDIDSVVECGTTIRVKIPLTLAIIPALIVESGGDRYAIPQIHLREVVRLKIDYRTAQIEYVHNAPVYRLRGRLLPLAFLREQLELPDCEAETAYIAVLQTDGRQFGLVVDVVSDSQEIVVKPLGPDLKTLGIYAGATILGDGRVSLILDVLGLATRAGLHEIAEASKPSVSTSTGVQTLLVLGMGERRLAIPMRHIARLEKIAVRAIERAGDLEVVQYRGEILPLVRFTQLLNGVSAATPDADLAVAVYAVAGRLIGLVADRIIDIVETTVELRPTAVRPGVLGTAVIQQRVTEIIDVPALLECGSYA